MIILITNYLHFEQSLADKWMHFYLTKTTKCISLSIQIKLRQTKTTNIGDIDVAIANARVKMLLS